MNTTITVNPAKLQATLEARPQGKGINLAGIVRVPYRMKAFTAVTIHTDATVDCEKTMRDTGLQPSKATDTAPLSTSSRTHSQKLSLH